jgi:type I restriction enzyme, S subunit
VVNEVVPKLRFPAFVHDAGWQQLRLGETGRFLRGLTYEAKDVQDGGLLVLRSSNIQSGNLVLDRDLVFVGKDCPNELCLQPGDIAICMSNGSKALVGKSAEYSGHYPGRLTVGAFCSIFRAGLPFAKLAFSTQQYADFVALEIGGGNINNLKNSSLEAFEFAVPRATDEQQQVAECLISLDAVISAQGRKVASLRTYKRGLIQLLFPREGESKPRLRFAEFRDAPSWQSDKAGTLFTNRSERGLHTLPVYSVTMTDGLVSRASLDRRVDDLADATANKRAYERDIVYNTMRMWQGACGVANTDCMLSPAYVVLAPKDEVYSPFFGYLFKQPHMLRLFTSHSRGLTEDRLRLYFDDFCDVPVQTPSFNEQRRIADCLTTFDRSIQTEMSRLDELNAHKRALMYQLFPSAEAV